MKPRISKSGAMRFAHEETTKITQYHFISGDGNECIGHFARTLCGHFFTVCPADPEYRLSIWSYSRPDGRPTCPECIEKTPYGYPGMLLVVRGALGVPQIVQVMPNESWVSVFGIFKGKVVSAQGKTVLHVCQNGDSFEDVGVAIVDGKVEKLGSKRIGWTKRS